MDLFLLQSMLKWSQVCNFIKNIGGTSGKTLECHQLKIAEDVSKNSQVRKVINATLWVVMYNVHVGLKCDIQPCS